MQNSKQHLTAAFSQLQEAQLNLQHAIETVEKTNNKVILQNTLNIVNDALYVASNTVANYQESEK